MQPESLMMTYGYNPHWSEGAIKCPIFQTSTFVFKTAEEGKAFFELAYGKRYAKPGEIPGLIYSRLNNPNMQILEERLCLWDEAEEAAAFESGMSAIATTLLSYLKPGDALIYGNPVYGGTHHFINHYLVSIGVEVLPIHPKQSLREITSAIEASKLANKVKMIYIETPANPTNDLFDIELVSQLANFLMNFTQSRPKIAVDNTYLGPVFQQPLKHGADLVLYSATKYLGGHSDLIAGVVLGKKTDLEQIKHLRTFLGNMISPNTAWLLMRSIETLKIRMEKQQENAQKVVQWLLNHSKIKRVYYPGIKSQGTEQIEIFKKQCLGPGAMISFDIEGGEKEAFTFLNRLKLIHLAVSLGSNESLAQHPYSMTHSDVPEDDKKLHNITPSMIRLSIGIEHVDDILADLHQALNF
ncbi:cystathionine gamma-synthase family protein [Schleiferia thermophila]|uniref:Methionine-gamma-lyase n=1 Tax=Schleiferia thermophila TaxID=884107 RepID=A0A368ZVP6_9FLAO|nr:cystathionine gamma-synthase family protein [Schleiferia thermophila]RCX01080.1 methionine-gamma-lyase [Schleiferia thermophila]GCD80878.1 methionine gamma-lyase [Schleiferia thermophila]